MRAAARSGIAALTLTGVLWGSIGVVVRLLQDAGVPTLSIAFWRLVCACLVLVPLVGGRGLRALAAAARRPRRLVAVSVGSLVFQLLFFVAVRDAGVAVATLVALGLAPVALAVAEGVRDRVVPGAGSLAVLACALAGLALVTGAGGTAGPRPLVGVLEAVASGLAYAASTGISGPLSSRLGPLTITLATSVIGAALLTPAVLVSRAALPRTPAAVAGVVWLGVIATVVAYGLFYAGLRTTPGSVATILTLLEPVTAVGLAAALLGERLTLANVAGGLLLVAAVAALSLRPPSRPPSPAG
ncbi:MAG TPA: DMT family transporter [Kineosporiaceae bacterium]|nr:DMT family transporter [Kineosporiaceae bacterium]